MGTNPLILILFVALAIICYRLFIKSGKKSSRRDTTLSTDNRRLTSIEHPPLRTQGQPEDLMAELRAELAALESSLKSPDQAPQGPQPHVMQSLTGIYSKLMELEKRLKTLERRAAEEERKKQQYEKP